MSLTRRSSIQVFQSVVFALIVREMKTRFGKWRLGYLWALLEPLISTIVLTLIITFLRGKSPWFGIPVPVFVASGYIFFQFFKTLSVQAVNSINSNKALFGYRQVKPFDTLVSRTILETMIFVCASLTLVLIGFWFFNFKFVPYDPMRATLVVIFLIVFSFGLGLIFAVLGSMYPEVTKLVPILNRPLLFISCVMYPLAAVPPSVQAWLLWNPILHAIEQFRFSLFPDYPGFETSFFYLVKCSVISVAFGMLLYTSNRQKLVAS